MKMGSLALGTYFHRLPYFLLYHHCSFNDVCLLIYVALDHPELEDQHLHQVHAAHAFAYEIEDFDDLVDPRRLFDSCLGPKPSKYVLEKICREEKSKIAYLLVPKILQSSLTLSILYMIACLIFG